MAKTVAEVLKESGMTDEQIAALDAKALAGFTQILSSASQTLEESERVHRAQEDKFVNEIAPALDTWANEKAAKDSEIAFYKTQLEGAKAGGFIPTTAPGAPTVTTRAADGKFVAGANQVPGSPQFMTKEDGFRAITNTQWALTEYMRLHNGAPLPDDLETLNSEAVAQHLPFRDYVAKKYDFSGKRDKIKADEQKKHDDAIVATALAENDKKWAEKVGNNPNTRQAEVSRFSDVRKAVKDGTRPDPLTMTAAERAASTRQAIRRDIVDSETVQ